jgi:hypothetical protein
MGQNNPSRALERNLLNKLAITEYKYVRLLECYRPAVFFRQLLLKDISLSQRKFRGGFKNVNILQNSLSLKLNHLNFLSLGQSL